VDDEQKFCLAAALLHTGAASFYLFICEGSASFQLRRRGIVEGRARQEVERKEGREGEGRGG